MSETELKLACYQSIPISTDTDAILEAAKELYEWVTEKSTNKITFEKVSQERKD